MDAATGARDDEWVWMNADKFFAVGDGDGKGIELVTFPRRFKFN